MVMSVSSIFQATAAELGIGDVGVDMSGSTGNKSTNMSDRGDGQMLSAKLMGLMGSIDQLHGKKIELKQQIENKGDDILSYHLPTLVDRSDLNFSAMTLSLFFPLSRHCARGSSMDPLFLLPFQP